MDGGRTFDGPEFRRRREAAGISLGTLMHRVALDRTLGIPDLRAHAKEAADRSFRHVQQAECGRRDISTDLVARLCHALTALSGQALTVDEVSGPQHRAGEAA